MAPSLRRRRRMTRHRGYRTCTSSRSCMARACSPTLPMRPPSGASWNKKGNRSRRSRRYRRPPDASRFHDPEQMRVLIDTLAHSQPFDPDAYAGIDDFAAALADSPARDIEFREKRLRPAEPPPPRITFTTSCCMPDAAPPDLIQHRLINLSPGRCRACPRTARSVSFLLGADGPAGLRLMDSACAAAFSWA